MGARLQPMAGRTDFTTELPVEYDIELSTRMTQQTVVDNSTRAQAHAAVISPSLAVATRRMGLSGPDSPRHPDQCTLGHRLSMDLSRISFDLDSSIVRHS